MYKRILLPISGKKRGHRAMDALVRALHITEGGEFILLHVCRPDSGGQGDVSQEEEAGAMLLMGPVIEYLRAEGRKFYTRVLSGSPAEAITRVAGEDNADVIVMFNDGCGHSESLRTTEGVISNAAVDVLVIRI